MVVVGCDTPTPPEGPPSFEPTRRQRLSTTSWAVTPGRLTQPAERRTNRSHPQPIACPPAGNAANTPAGTPSLSGNPLQSDETMKHVYRRRAERKYD